MSQNLLLSNAATARIGRWGCNFAYAKLHSNELGGIGETVQLGFQAIQRVREHAEPPSATSVAAQQADKIYVKIEEVAR